MRRGGAVNSALRGSESLARGAPRPLLRGLKTRRLVLAAI